MNTNGKSMDYLSWRVSQGKQSHVPSSYDPGIDVSSTRKSFHSTIIELKKANNENLSSNSQIILKRRSEKFTQNNNHFSSITQIHKLISFSL